MALQSGFDTFTTQHVSMVSCSDNKGPFELEDSVLMHRLGTRLLTFRPIFVRVGSISVYSDDKSPQSHNAGGRSSNLSAKA